MVNMNVNVRRSKSGRLSTDEELSNLFKKGVEDGKYATPMLRFIEDHLDGRFVPGFPFKVVVAYGQTVYKLGILYNGRVITLRDHIKDGKERVLWEWLLDMNHLFRPHIPVNEKKPTTFHEYLQHYVLLSHTSVAVFSEGCDIDSKRFREMMKGDLNPSISEVDKIERHLRRNNVIVTNAYRYAVEKATSVDHLDGYPSDLKENVRMLLELRTRRDRKPYRDLSRMIKEKYKEYKG